MRKHTQGPWAKSDRIEGAIGKGSDPLAICFATSEGDIVWMNDSDYTLAVSAPDLLEALENLLDAYSEPDDRICCNGTDCGCMGATKHQQAEHYAKEAIARAKGEPS